MSHGDTPSFVDLLNLIIARAGTIEELASETGVRADLLRDWRRGRAPTTRISRPVESVDDWARRTFPRGHYPPPGFPSTGLAGFIAPPTTPPTPTPPTPLPPDLSPDLSPTSTSLPHSNGDQAHLPDVAEAVHETQDEKDETHVVNEAPAMPGGVTPGAAEPDLVAVGSADDRDHRGSHDHHRKPDIDPAGPRSTGGRRRRRSSVGVVVAVAALLVVLVVVAIMAQRPDSRAVPGPDPIDPPPGPTATVIVQNMYATGPSTLAEDDTPSYLSTRPVPRCAEDGCMVPGSELWTGDVLIADCTVQAERPMTNANIDSPGVRDNPGAVISNLWYHATTSNGLSGLISEVYLAPRYRGGLGLPVC